MRIVIELKKGCVAGVVMNQLFSHTALKTSYGIIMLAIVNGQPKIVNLKEALQLFVDHRREIVVRRTIYRLGEAEKRLHILEGLKIAIEAIDEVIALMNERPSLKERASASKRITAKIVSFVETFIEGMG